MIVFATLLVLFVVAEAFLFWHGTLLRRREEELYWRIRDQRPPLYDWSKELDL